MRYGLILCVLIVYGCKEQNINQCKTEEKKVSQEKIVDIAKEHILLSGYPSKTFEGRKVIVDDGNMIWKKNLDGLKQQAPDIAEKYRILLDKRDYQAVGFILENEKCIGGDIWVFVDKKTGEIITSVSGI
jgi:hypothetical protein